MRTEGKKTEGMRVKVLIEVEYELTELEERVAREMGREVFEGKINEQTEESREEVAERLSVEVDEIKTYEVTIDGWEDE